MSKKKNDSKALEAKFGSPDKPLIIEGVEIQCFVLENGERVIVQRALFRALGINQGSTRNEKYKEFGGAARLAQFLESNSLIDLTTNEIGVLLKDPIVFSYNNTIHYGYKATLLQDITRTISKSYLRGLLPPRYAELGRNAELLDDALGKVGIISLVDEATGYQKFREKDALKVFLEKFLLEERGKWVSTFPDEFFEAIFKMKGWDWKLANKGQKPSVMGHYINNYVYARLAPKVLEELRKKNPKTEKGYRKYKHPQFIDVDFGHPLLKQHLHALTALARASGFNWKNWIRSVERAYPKFGDNLSLDFPDNETEEQ